MKRASEVVVRDGVATGRVRHASMGSCAAAGVVYRAALRASEGRLSRRDRGVGRAETRATSVFSAKPVLDASEERPNILPALGIRQSRGVALFFSSVALA